MIKQFKQFYRREVFTPSILGVFFHPYYISRHGLHKGIVSNKHYLKGKMLDFGCGSKPYKHLITVDEYIGLDIENSGHDHKQKNEQIDIFYDGKIIPFDANHFDSLLSTEVFEHVFNIDEVISELFRVIKPGGYLVITIPFAIGEHEIPYDFARYTSFGITHLLNKAGFEIMVMEKTTNSVETIFQLWNFYIYNHIFSNSIVKLLLTPILLAPVTILGIVFSKILSKNQDLYLNNVVVAKKPLLER